MQPFFIDVTEKTILSSKFIELTIKGIKTFRIPMKSNSNKNNYLNFDEDQMRAYLTKMSKIQLLGFELAYGTQLFFNIIIKYANDDDFLKNLNVNMLLVSCVILSHKMMCDIGYNLKIFSILLSIDFEDLNNSELYCLSLLNYNLFIPAEQINKLLNAQIKGMI
jgi:hypothetical protein